MSAPTSLAPGDSLWLRLIGGLVVAIGLVVIAGFVSGYTILRSFYPGVPGVVMNAALCGLLCGGALLALAQGWRLVATVCSVLVAVLCGTIYYQHWVGGNWGIDDLFWHHAQQIPGGSPGRMGPPAAGAYLLVGLALLLRARQGGRSWLLPLIGAAVGTFAALPLIHFAVLWWVSPEPVAYWDVAVPSVASLILLSAALIGRPDQVADRLSESIRFVCVGLGVIVAVWVFWWLRQEMLEKAELAVQRSREIRSCVSDLGLAVIQLDSASRAYVLSGGAPAASAYQASRRTIQEQLMLLPVLENGPYPALTDTPEQIARVERLRGLVRSKLAQSAELVAGRQAGAASEADRRMARQLPVANEITRLIAVVRQEEIQQGQKREIWRAARAKSAGAVQGLGNIVGLVFMLAAVLRSVRAEKALAAINREQTAARQRLETTFGTMSEGLVLQDKVHGIIEANAAAARILGLTHDQLIGRTSMDPNWRAVDAAGASLPGERHPAMITLGTGQPQRGVVLGVHRGDGTRVWVSINSEPVRGADGRVQAVVVSFADITARREREEALRASEARFRTFARLAPVGIYETNAEGACLFVNPRWCKIAGVSAADAQTGSWGRTMHPEDRPRVAAVWQAFVAQRGDFVVEYRFCPPAGGVVWVTETAVPLRDEQGRISGYLGAVTDITERKELEQTLALSRDEALESSRLKSEFLATISHEIRTPMNAVIGMTELLVDTLERPNQREMGEVIRGGAESLLAIINDILDLSKIEAGKLRIEVGEFDPRALFEECLTLLAVRAQAKKLELLGDLDPALPGGLLGDPGRLRQVLLNLVGNAIKFTERGEVVVKARLKPIAETGRILLRVEVRDTGIGIPFAAQRRLFQPFVQVDGSTTRRFGGTGLGLAISRQLVELMGGEIGFVSTEGAGATFWFQLPLPVAPTNRLAWPKLEPGLRVLVVDDNASSRAILLAQLKQWGVEAVGSASAEEALLRLQAAWQQDHPFDLAVIDSQMPDQDGLALAVAIRGQPAITTLPLILLVAAPIAGDEVTPLGFLAVLNKPVRLAELHRVLNQARRTSPPPREKKPPIAVPVPAAPSGLHLLLAEDNETNQVVARRLLEKLGHRIEIVGNGAEAVERLRSQSYDAVLMDCQMPVMDGYTATREIRVMEQAGGLPRRPIIALTAYVMPSDRLKCFAAGMDDYVPKPLRLSELQQALARVGLSAPALAPAGEATGPTPPPAGEDEPALDPKQLEVLRDLPGRQHATLLQDVAETFLVEAPAALARLEKALTAQDAAELMAQAHRFAGACANMGAAYLRAGALELETAAAAGRWPEAAAHHATLLARWRTLEPSVRAQLPPA